MGITKYEKGIKVLIILTFLSCKNSQIPTYEEGLNRCTERVEKEQKDHPGRIVLFSRDCIVGSSLPEFTAQTLSGQVIDHHYFIGKISIINFWFETCAPCVAEIPTLDKLIDKYGKEKFNYLAVGRDTDQDIIDFLQDHPWRFEQVSNGVDLIENAFLKIKWGYPTTFIVNQKGVIIAAFGGIDAKVEVELERVLERIRNNE